MLSRKWFSYIFLTILTAHNFCICGAEEDTTATVDVMRARPRDFVEYVEGDSNLIITVPHGGSLRPAALRARTACPGRNVFK